MFKAVRFTVRGRGPFPFDMLRYDGCHPENQADVSAMMKSDGRDVKLMMYHRPGEPDTPNRDRWASYTWNVVEESIASVN